MMRMVFAAVAAKHAQSKALITAPMVSVVVARGPLVQRIKHVAMVNVRAKRELAKRTKFVTVRGVVNVE